MPVLRCYANFSVRHEFDWDNLTVWPLLAVCIPIAIFYGWLFGLKGLPARITVRVCLYTVPFTAHSGVCSMRPMCHEHVYSVQRVRCMCWHCFWRGSMDHYPLSYWACARAFHNRQFPPLSCLVRSVLRSDFKGDLKILARCQIVCLKR